jgi:hypothetical protein
LSYFSQELSPIISHHLRNFPTIFSDPARLSCDTLRSSAIFSDFARHFAIFPRHFTASCDFPMFSQPVHTVHLNQFTLPMALDSLALLAIILDVFAILCARFAISSIYCDLLAISVYLLRFLMISSTFTSTPQPFPSSTLTSATQQPYTSQSRSETLQTPHIAPSNRPITMPLRHDHSAPHFDPSQPRKLHRYFADLTVSVATARLGSAQLG